MNDLEMMPDDWNKALAVVAHPDDMEFAAAGAVAAWTSSGKSVDYLLLTRGEAGIAGMDPARVAKVREAEQRRSAQLVGVERLDFLDYADGVIEYSLDLRRDIAAAIRRAKPDLVIGFNHHDRSVGGKPNSADHRHAGQAAIDAIADAANEAIFPEIDEPIWTGVKYIAIGQSPAPTHAVDISDHIDVAVASLEAHATYLESIGIAEVRGPLEGYAASVGSRIGVAHALSFELYPA